MGALVFVVMVAGAVVLLRPSGSGDGAVVPGAWRPLPDAGLSGRSEATAVWTGRAMLVWGGNGESGPAGDGAAFELPAGTWRPLAATPHPARRSHSAVWTGTRMIVFGGVGATGPLNDAAAYDPATDGWTALAPAPIEARSGHAAVWVQNRMVVWGGAGQGGQALADGASYDPATDRWTVLPPSPLAARVGHRAVATTHRMLVWGGSSEAEEGGRYFADGAVYSPATNSWAAMAPVAGLAPRDTFGAVWTGEQLVVWGGYGRGTACSPCLYSDGAAYDLDTDSWTPISPSPLSGRGGHLAVWTGREMLVWGGFDGAEQADGALYSPHTDSWARVVAGPSSPRQHHSMVWAGRQLLIWGGQGPRAKLDDGALLSLGDP